MSIGVDDDNDNDNKDSLLEVSKKDNNDNSDEIGVNRSDINPLFELPKFHFFDFFYNNTVFDLGIRHPLISVTFSTVTNFWNLGRDGYLGQIQYIF